MDRLKNLNTISILCIVTLFVGSILGQSQSKRRVTKIDGNIILGALFPMHKQPSLKVAFTRQCGPIWEQYGIHRIEIFLKTLDEINANHNILPNVTLGCDIRDSCWYPPVALEQSIDFIKNSIASLEAASKSKEKLEREKECDSDRQKPIAGLIGPGSSTVTVQVQNLLSLFNIPQIGYSATMQELSDKSLYNYFMRVVPSDKLQARALLDIVLHYNWTYVSTVYTQGNYGASGLQEFREMMKEAGLCEAATDDVQNNAPDAAYDKVIDTLLEKENARVVICFCEGNTIRGLLSATQRKGRVGHFVFIGSDGWNVRPDVVENIEPIAAGGFSIKLYSPKIKDFDDYYFNLNPKTNTRNTWFREFWQQKFKCYMQEDEEDAIYDKPCTGNESLSQDYDPDAKLGFVVNAIYTMAYALDQMYRDMCPDLTGLCAAMEPINGTLFMQYLLNVSFISYSDDPIHFNENGDPPGRYDIMNYQPVTFHNGTYTYDYVAVGGWDQGNITIYTEKVFFPGQQFGSGPSTVKSVCSEPCPSGQVKKLNSGGIKCCWVCTPCKENEILVDETCKPCQQGWWPNTDLTACEMIMIEFMQWGDTEAIVAMVFACTGVFVTGWVALVFIRHNNTPVVKASTRELSYIILIGICTSFLTTFPLVAKPTIETCYLTRILPGFSFSLIYGALVTKTNRIARILAGSKKKIMTRKPRFMSASAQVVITFILIGIECAIITVMLIKEPADSQLIYPAKTRVRLACNASTMGIIVPLGFDILLIVLCTLYAIKTRNLPENFNEAKFIGFTMYTTCVIWTAFVPIYFGSDNKVITMCLAITLSATVALVLLFFPKIYIIVCKPERNNRSAFTTSKDVRCHIGSTSRSFPSHDSMNRPESNNSLYQWRVHQGPGTKIVCEKQMEVIWNEKSFEHAALTLYRQRNVFNRWKNKGPPGEKEDISSGHMYNQMSPSGAPFNDPISSPQINASQKVVTRLVEPPKRIRAPAPFADFQDVCEFEDEFEAMENAVVAVDEVIQSTGKVETGVQTGEELLEKLLNGLRRRRKASRDSQVSSESKQSFGGKSDRVKGKSSELGVFNHGANDHLSPISCVSVSSHDATDSSPLLTTGRDCDSTSEETLSERDPLADLDDLLNDDVPHGGSFGTLQGSKLSLTDTDQTVWQRPPAPVTQSSSSLSRRASSPSQLTDMSTPSALLLPRNSLTESWANQKAVVPHIQVECASEPSTTECSLTSADSGRQTGPDSGRLSFRNGMDPKADRTSAEVSSIEDFSVYSMNHSDSDHSVFDRSRSGSKNNKMDSVTEFQEYLRTKGLKLDMNSVQSSEV